MPYYGSRSRSPLNVDPKRWRLCLEAAAKRLVAEGWWPKAGKFPEVQKWRAMQLWRAA